MSSSAHLKRTPVSQKNVRRREAEDEAKSHAPANNPPKEATEQSANDVDDVLGVAHIQQRIQHLRQRSAVIRPVANLVSASVGDEAKSARNNNGSSSIRNNAPALSSPSVNRNLPKTIQSPKTPSKKAEVRPPVPVRQAAGTPLQRRNPPKSPPVITHRQQSVPDLASNPASARDEQDVDMDVLNELIAAMEKGDVDALERLEMRHTDPSPGQCADERKIEPGLHSPQSDGDPQANELTPSQGQALMSPAPPPRRVPPQPPGSGLGQGPDQGLKVPSSGVDSPSGSPNRAPNSSRKALDPFAQLPESTNDLEIPAWQGIDSSAKSRYSAASTLRPSMGIESGIIKSEARAGVQRAQLAALVSVSGDRGLTTIPELKSASDAPTSSTTTVITDQTPSFWSRLFGRAKHVTVVKDANGSSCEPPPEDDQTVFDNFVRSAMYNRYEREIVYHIDMLRRSNTLNDDQYDFALVVCDKVIGPISDAPGPSSMVSAEIPSSSRASAYTALRPPNTIGNSAGHGMTEAALDGEITNLAESLLDHHAKTWKAAVAMGTAAPEQDDGRENAPDSNSMVLQPLSITAANASSEQAVHGAIKGEKTPGKTQVVLASNDIQINLEQGDENHPPHASQQLNICGVANPHDTPQRLRHHRRNSVVLAGNVRRPPALLTTHGSENPESHDHIEGDSAEGAFELQRSRLRQVLYQASLHAQKESDESLERSKVSPGEVQTTSKLASKDSSSSAPESVMTILESLPSVANVRARKLWERKARVMCSPEKFQESKLVDESSQAQANTHPPTAAGSSRPRQLLEDEPSQKSEMQRQQLAMLAMLEQQRAKRTKQMLTLPRTLVARSPDQIAGAGLEGAGSIEMVQNPAKEPGARNNSKTPSKRSVATTPKHVSASPQTRQEVEVDRAVPQSVIKVRKVHERVRKASSVLIQERLENAGLLVKREALKLTEEEGWQLFPCSCCHRKSNSNEHDDGTSPQMYRRLVLIKVCAPPERLEIEAEAMRLNMRLRKGGHCPFERSIRHAFLGTADPSCLFRSSERQFILDRIIRSPAELGGAELSEYTPLGKAIIDRFPLHMYARLAGLAHWVKPWRYTIEQSIDINQPSSALGSLPDPEAGTTTSGVSASSQSEPTSEEGKEPSSEQGKVSTVGCLRRAISLGSSFFNQPLDAIADYFGEQVAFYFAWLEFYTKWLIVPAVAGVLLTVQIALWSSEVDRGANIVQVSSLDSPYIPIYSALLSIWSVLMIRCWERRASELAYRWGVINYEENDEQLRPEFKGKLRFHPVKQIMLRHYPVWKRALKLMFSVPFLIILVAIPCFFVIWLFNGYDNALKEHQIKGGFNGLATINEPLLWAPVLWGAFVPVYDEIYTFIANKLNHWENWAKHSTHQKSFIAKVFSLRFLNSFLVLYYFAFADMGVMRISTSLASFLIMGTISQYIINLSIPAFLRWRATQKLKRQAGKELLRLFVNKATKIFMAKLNAEPALRRDVVVSLNANSDMAQEEVDMRLQKAARMHARAAGAGLEENRAVLSRFVTQAWVESRRPPHDSFREHAMLIIQYGYVVLFSATLPIAPFIVLIKNLVDIRTGAWKLCNLSKRPIAAKSSGIGVWLDVIRILSFVSSVTNTILIAFASKQLDKWWDRPITLSDRLLFVFVCEHVFLIISWVIDRMLPSVPFHIRFKVDQERKALHKQQARNQHGDELLHLKQYDSELEGVDDHGTGALGFVADERATANSRFTTLA